MIKVKDLHFCGPSVVDSFGRVFEYNGEYYRMIYKSSESACRELLESALLKELIQLGYIPDTKITTDIQVEGAPIVLKHDTCYINKPNEWSFEMFKDAAIHLLKVNNICNQHGFELKDGHLLNITFHKGKPVFYDIGSIVKREGENWRAEQEFLQKSILPLLLWANGEYCILRNILESHDQFAENRLLPQQSFLDTIFFGEKLITRISQQVRIRQRTFSVRSDISIGFFHFTNKITNRLFQKKYFHITKKQELLNPSIETISKIKLKEIVKTEWDSYQNYDNINENFPRFRRIIELIKNYCSDAESVVDLAGNGGSLSILLHETGLFDHLFNIDYDGSAVDKAYLYIKENKLSIDTIYSNVIFPFDSSSFYSRVQSDIAIACALTHHLILRQGIPLYAIFEKISAYTKKYIIIEFMPLGLWNGDDAPPVPDWYNEKWFKNTMEEYFEVIHYEQLEKNRIAFVGKKRVES